MFTLLPLVQVVLVHQPQVGFQEPKVAIQFLQPLHLMAVVAAVVLLTLLAPQLLVALVVAVLVDQQIQLVQTEQQSKEQRAATEHIQHLTMVQAAAVVLAQLVLTELLQQAATVAQVLLQALLAHQ
jgi:hypothetical protein